MECSWPLRAITRTTFSPEDVATTISWTLNPASEGVVSATVVGSDCLEADALVTALVLLGPGRGFELLEKQGFCGLIVYRTDSESESAPLAYKATESFLDFMIPELAGIPIP